MTGELPTGGVRGWQDDEGSALVEFVVLGVLLLVPLVYVLLTALLLQRGSFAAVEGARSAARVFATSSAATRDARAELAARITLTDQGLDRDLMTVAARCETDCGPGEWVRATVEVRVPLPLLPSFLGTRATSVPVAATHRERVDSFVNVGEGSR